MYDYKFYYENFTCPVHGHGPLVVEYDSPELCLVYQKPNYLKWSIIFLSIVVTHIFKQIAPFESHDFIYFHSPILVFTFQLHSFYEYLAS